MYQKLVLEDKTYSEAAKDLLCSYTAVRNWANKFGLSRLDRWKLLNEKHGDEICSKYVDKDLLLSELAKEYQTNYKTIKVILNHHNIPLKNKSQVKLINDSKKIHRIYSLNEDYFKIWNNNMAYVLGFIASDGCIGVNEYKDGSRIKKKYVLTFNLQESDVKLLEDIKSEFSYEGNVRRYRNNNGSYYCTLRIHSKKIIKDLQSIGIHERKSLDLTLPKIPTEYQLDFIRGYFDGDGSIDSQYPTNSKGVKTNIQQIRFRICSGSKQILEQIGDIFSQYGLKHKKVMKSRQLYEIAYSTKESYKIYDLLYYNQNVLCLKRKKDKFEELIKIRNEQLQNK